MSIKLVQLCCIIAALAFIVTLLVVEAIAVTDRVAGNTISGIAQRAGQRDPILPFAVCLLLNVLVAHFWWNKGDSWIGPMVVLVSVAGLVVGRLLWPQ